MGRKTFESIGKKPLPGRENFALSRSSQKSENSVTFFTSLEEAIKNAPTENIFIIGGETLFKETMRQADGIYLTKIDALYEGDVFYPEIPAGFKEKSRIILQENPKLEFIYYENMRKDAKI